jgi:hypothetical protein
MSKKQKLAVIGAIVLAGMIGGVVGQAMGDWSLTNLGTKRIGGNDWVGGWAYVNVSVIDGVKCISMQNHGVHSMAVSCDWAGKK